MINLDGRPGSRSMETYPRLKPWTDVVAIPGQLRAVAINFEPLPAFIAAR